MTWMCGMYILPSLTSCIYTVLCFYNAVSLSLWDPIFADVPQIWIFKKYYVLCTECISVTLTDFSTNSYSFLYFKHSPCPECYILCFGWFPGVWILYADVSEHSVCSVFLPAHTTYKNVTERVFRNVGTHNSDAGESHKRKNTTAIFSFVSLADTFLGISCEIKNNIFMWTPRPSVCPSVRGLVSVTKMFIGFSRNLQWEFLAKYCRTFVSPE